MKVYGYPDRAPGSPAGPNRGAGQTPHRPARPGQAGHGRAVPRPASAVHAQDHLPDVRSDRMLTREPAAGPAARPGPSRQPVRARPGPRCARPGTGQQARRGCRGHRWPGDRARQACR